MAAVKSGSRFLETVNPVAGRKRDFELSNRVYKRKPFTDGSSGVGLAIAITLTAQGFGIAIVTKDTERLR
jgi:hypothetical protein